jgi:hypothetical protein
MKIATGWLGWSEEQALDADMNTIVLAYHGKTEMLKAIFGSTDDKPSKSKPKPTAKQVKNFAKTHNAVETATKKKKGK